MLHHSFLERLYRQYNRREYVHPDPLEFLYRYPSLPDREIAGLIAASLAYGRVTQILRSVARALDPLEPSPRAFILNASPGEIRARYKAFRHRFADGSHVAALLIRIRSVLCRHGSLHALFLRDLRQEHETVLPALQAFARELQPGTGHLIACPDSGSACKRLNLYLRWMVRQDSVDPGGWTDIRPAQLVVPLDTHMARIARSCRLTARKSPNMGMALDLTRAFRKMQPDDPVRYDFVLTRFGIHPDFDKRRLLRRLQNPANQPPGTKR